MKIKNVAFVSVILTGYVGISFGVLKIFWRQFGVHFYAPSVEHLPHSGIAVDSALILVMVLSGMCLVVVRSVVPALLFLIGTFLYEFTVNHHDVHSLWQYAFAIGSITAQVMTLAIYVVGYSVFDKAFIGIRRRFPPQDV